LLLYASWEAGKVKKGFDSGATSNKACLYRYIHIAADGAY
jgi:hypothetical protein